MLKGGVLNLGIVQIDFIGFDRRVRRAFKFLESHGYHEEPTSKEFCFRFANQVCTVEAGSFSYGSGFEVTIRHTSTSPSQAMVVASLSSNHGGRLEEKIEMCAAALRAAGEGVLGGDLSPLSPTGKPAGAP